MSNCMQILNPTSNHFLSTQRHHLSNISILDSLHLKTQAKHYITGVIYIAHPEIVYSLLKSSISDAWQVLSVM